MVAQRLGGSQSNRELSDHVGPTVSDVDITSITVVVRSRRPVLAQRGRVMSRVPLSEINRWGERVLAPVLGRLKPDSFD
ncbi:hypothetical protein EVAR_20796_1 [Eumeta japonica]|uniref:Uncharacterized protein n=1 Tax=Eumeta variegata TaxID=151549 RepID=A0A4C1UES6_EUMVA|nr:hypothetical protein EVAR_20796_1 [Eumeta japonica]